MCDSELVIQNLTSKAQGALIPGNSLFLAVSNLDQLPLIYMLLSNDTMIVLPYLMMSLYCYPDIIAVLDVVTSTSLHYCLSHST